MKNKNRVKTMEKRAKYLYVVRMDADPETEKQFNEWYNKEHIPALLKVPGVISANRFTSLEGTPKYIAIYELDDPHVRASEAWKKAVEMTPRPKDVTIQNATRNLYERIYPKK
jgi:antibiotic biosynthesis monooxygenase (ABM) superfamily enzyme